MFFILLVPALLTSLIAPLMVAAVLKAFQKRIYYRPIWAVVFSAVVIWTVVAFFRSHAVAAWYADPDRLRPPGGEGFGGGFYHAFDLLYWIVCYLPSVPCFLTALAMRGHETRFAHAEFVVLVILGGSLFTEFAYYWAIGVPAILRHNKWTSIGATPVFAPDGKLLGLSFHRSHASLKPLDCELALRGLSLRNCNIDTADWKYLAPLSNLRELDLARTNISDADLVYIENHIALRRLDLEKTNVTDQGMDSIGTLTGLRILSVRDTNVTDDAFRKLIALEHLEHLSLDGTRVTGKGSQALSQLKTLETISLERTPVDEAGLREICGLPRVVRVAVRHTGISLDLMRQIEHDVRKTKKSFGIDPRGESRAEKIARERTERGK